MKKINASQINWEPASHEDPKDPGVLKQVIVRHNEVDPKSKLMMVNLCRVPVGKTHIAHLHKTMEEYFYFTSGQGQVKIDNEVEKVHQGDRIIVPANSTHEVKNTGKTELEYVCLGVALD